VTEVQATFSLTEHDLVRTALAVGRRDRRVVYMFSGLVAVLIVGSGAVARDGPRYGLMLLQLSVLGAMVFVFWVYPRIGVRRNGRLEAHLAPQEWRFGPEGARVVSGASSAAFPWSSVVRVVEDADYLFVFVGEALAHPVPKRALSPQTLTALRSGLREWVSGRVELRDGSDFDLQP
jgi:hypothetical protein